jgi:hypothetical protein
MTFAAALTAIKTVRRPFVSSGWELPTEPEASHGRIAVPDPDPLEWPPRPTPEVELITQAFLKFLGR